MVPAADKHRRMLAILPGLITTEGLLSRVMGVCEGWDATQLLKVYWEGKGWDMWEMAVGVGLCMVSGGIPPPGTCQCHPAMAAGGATMCQPHQPSPPRWAAAHRTQLLGDDGAGWGPNPTAGQHTQIYRFRQVALCSRTHQKQNQIQPSDLGFHPESLFSLVFA